MQISGTSDREPLKHGLRQSLWCGGLNAAYASLAAHLGGGGVHVDLSLQECVASELVLNEAHYAFMGAVQGRRPPGGIRSPASRCRPPTAGCRCRRAGSSPRSSLADLFGDAAPRRSALREHRVAHASRRRAERRSSPSTRHGVAAATSSCAPRAQGYLSGFVQTPPPPRVPAARGARGSGTRSELTCPASASPRRSRRCRPRRSASAGARRALGEHAVPDWERRRPSARGARGKRPWPACASSTSPRCSRCPTSARCSPTSAPR